MVTKNPHPLWPMLSATEANRWRTAIPDPFCIHTLGILLLERQRTFTCLRNSLLHSCRSYWQAVVRRAWLRMVYHIIGSLWWQVVMNSSWLGIVDIDIIISGWSRLIVVHHGSRRAPLRILEVGINTVKTPYSAPTGCPRNSRDCSRVSEIQGPSEKLNNSIPIKGFIYHGWPMVDPVVNINHY